VEGYYISYDQGTMQEWFACCLAEYEAGARHGRTFGDVFGLRLGPGESPWWEVEDLARRDDRIRYIRARFFPRLSRRAATDAIARKVRCYELSAWRQDKECTTPPHGASEITRAMFELLKIGALVSLVTVDRALRHEIPVLMPHEVGDSGSQETTNEGTPVEKAS
jgi:hypothetical protein